MQTLESVLALMLSLDSIQRRRLGEDRLDPHTLWLRAGCAPELLALAVPGRRHQKSQEEVGIMPNLSTSFHSPKEDTFLLVTLCKVSI